MALSWLLLRQFVFICVLAKVAFSGKVKFEESDKNDEGIEKDYITTTGDCNSFKDNLPDGCTASFDCSTITCKTKYIEKDLILTFTINKCEEPVTVTARVQIEDLGIDFSHTFSTSEKIAIPGFTYSILIGKFGVYLGIDLTPDDDDIMEMKVSLFIGGTVLGQEGYLPPLTVMDENIPISTDECGIVRWWNNLSVTFQILVVGGGVAVVIIFFIVCCCCCCRRRTPGRVLPPVSPNPNIMVTTQSKVPLKPLAECA